MKRIYKIMVFVLMIALAIGSVAFAPITTVFAIGAAAVGATIVLTTMPKNGTLNKEIKIPIGTAKAGEEGTDLEVKIVDPRGKELVLGNGADKQADLDAGKYVKNDTDYSFLPKLVGNYKVTYTATEKNGYKSTSESFTISVTSTKATLSLPENSPFILQNKIGKDSTLVLPYPTVKIDDEEVEDAEVTVRVIDPQHKDWVNEQIREGRTNPLATKVLDGKTYYTLKPAKKDEDILYGTYSIQYIYRNSNTGEVTTKAYAVTVSANYSVENQKVTFTWQGSLPESAVLGNEVTLPTPITVDANKNNASVATYTQVKVEYYNSNNELVDGNIAVEDYKFKPMYEAKGGSYYQITYKIFTLENLDLGNADYTTLEAALIAGEANALVKTYSLTNVTDTVAPVPQIVAKEVNNALVGYEVEDDGTLAEETIEELKDLDASYAIPTKAKVEKEIDIPAIYATDNYNSYKDLSLERTLLDENGKTYSLDGSSTVDSVENSPKVVQSAVNNIAKVTFYKAGTYTIRYRATDKANNQKEISQTIVVTTDLDDDVAPKITLPTIVATARPGDKVSFTAPTIVDYETDETSAVTVDANVKKDVYYFYNNSNTFTDEQLEGKIGTEGFNLLKNKEDDKTLYEFEIDEDANKSYVIVAFRAEDDAKYSAHGENNIAWKYKAIRLYNVDDDIAPTLYVKDVDGGDFDLQGYANGFLDSGENKYGQGDLVELDDIGILKFKDKDNHTDEQDPKVYTTNYLTASLKVFDKNGKEIKVTGVKYVYDGEYFVIKGGKFVTTVAAQGDDYYSIVITATDLGGNSLINSVKFQVNDTKAPIVEVENVETTMELGKEYVLPTPVVIDDGEEIENRATSIVEFGDDNPAYDFNHATNVFIPREIGTYTFRFVGEDNSPQENKTYTGWYSVTVNDTIKPVIYIDENNGYTVPETAAYRNDDGDVVKVELPLFSAIDEFNGIEDDGIMITVKNPNGDEITAEIVDDTHYEFTPNQNGVYTVIYKAVDKAGNSATETYSIKVGDVTAPTITVETQNVPGTYNIGDTVSVDLSKVTTVDDVDGTKKGSEEYNNGLEVKLVGPDGEAVEWTKEDEILTYEFTKAGTYTLTYKATDKAGNSDDTAYTFEVRSTPNSSSVAETVWGVVLVVASLALLSGVVIYFVRTKDKPDAKEKKKD